MATSRLSPDSWIEAGFDALLAQGPSALKAEPLARRLTTTKGSFYWHFKDVTAYHDALLDRWENNTKSQILAPASDGSSAVQRLRHLVQSPDQSDTARLEPAMRAWARNNEKAAKSVARIDAQRIAQLTQILGEIGLSNPELSRIIYAANLGMTELSEHDGQDNQNALGTLVDLVLALYS